MRQSDDRSRSDSPRNVVAGWSRRRFTVAGGPILDVGSGAFPNAAADILVDLELSDSRHRHGLPLITDRPLAVALVEALPFGDATFTFAIASHIAEHVEDPAGLCEELSRVAQRGYIETPSPIADVLLHEDYHLWRVRSRRGKLLFTAKGPRPRRVVRATEPFYRAFYAGRTDSSRRVYPLPRGRIGRMLALILKAIAAGLARIGVMHTRHEFGPDHPLVFEVRGRLPGRG
jgi:hypothetical protein